MLEEARLLDEDIDAGSTIKNWGTSINVNGETYATSLFWQPLQNASDPFQEVEDASAGVLDGADLFCIKNGKAPQFGICVSHEGYNSGQNVAAVALATALSDIGSFIAVFKTNNGWWYTCVRNDIILSDGDMLFLTEEEAKEQFISMLAVPDWGKKIAPKEWDLEDTEEFDLAEILQRGAKAKLQKIKALRGTKLLLVIAISAVVGIWLLSSLVDKLFLTPTVKPVIVPIKPKALPKVTAPAPIEVPKPWEKIANQEEIMKNCYEGIKNLSSILPPGWQIGDLACANNKVATNWIRNTSVGRLSWAKKALVESGLDFAGYSFSPNGELLSASLNLPMVEEALSPPEKAITELQDELNETFQSLGLSVTLSMDAVQVSSPAVNGQPSVGKSYQRLLFSFTSEHNPLIWASLLTKYSGLEIKIITYSTSNRMWNYEGAIYVL